MSTVQVTLPDSVLREAVTLAALDKVPLDDFVALAIADRVSALRGLAYLKERADRGKNLDIKSILQHSPDVEPDANDRIE